MTVPPPDIRSDLSDTPGSSELDRPRKIGRRALILGGAALVAAAAAEAVIHFDHSGKPRSPKSDVPSDSTPSSIQRTAYNTGVRPGVQLETVGALTVGRGTHYKNLHIRGPVNIQSTEDVYFSNCRVTGPVRNDTSKETGIVHLTDCEVAGIVRVARVNANRVYVHDANDLWTPFVSSTITDSYLSKPIRVGNLHPDCAQFNGGQHVMRNCTLDAVADYTPAQAARINSCVQITADQGACKVDLIGCFFRGGNYSVNLKTQPDAELVMTDCKFFTDGRKYGSLIGIRDRMTLTDNVDLGVGPITPHFV